MHSLIKNTLKQCYHRLLPYTCVICKSPSQQALDLCSACENDLPFLQNACSLCGASLAKNSPPICGNCLTHPPPYHDLICLAHYQGPIRRFITQLKFHQQLAFSHILGHLFVKHMGTHQTPDMIIPVPLHTKRLKQRGFNQALEIAKVIQKQLNIPINHTICQRIRHTQPQTSLPAHQRARNVKKAFTVRGDLSNHHVAVVDDVMTTGHTMREVCCALRKAGTKRVSVWCIAKTG